jgi:hypothetical protein
VAHAILLPSDIPEPRPTAEVRAEEGRLADQSMAEAQVLERITESGARVAIAVLDACRDNPLRSANVRSLGSARGLTRSSPAEGGFSIYSAGFGQQALDSLGPDDHNANSVFTRVFVEKLKTPGLDLRAVALKPDARSSHLLRKLVTINSLPITTKSTATCISLVCRPLLLAHRQAYSMPRLHWHHLSSVSRLLGTRTAFDLVAAVILAHVRG